MIERSIWLMEKRRIEPINVVYGSSLPIKFHIEDTELRDECTAIAYAKTDGMECYKCNCTVTGNDIILEPAIGLFQAGKNELQIEIRSNANTLITFILDAYCDRYMGSGDDEPVSPEAVLPYVQRAENAALQVEQELAELDGHGGIQKIEQTSTSGTAGNGMVRTYTVTYGDGETTTFTVKDGTKGNKGDTGTASSISSATAEYAVSTSNTSAPSSGWNTAFPSSDNKGKYIWTRITITFNSGNPVVFYSHAYQGTDGAGAVNSVNGKTGTIVLTASDVSAVATTEKLSAVSALPVSSENLSKVGTMQAVKDYVEKYIASIYESETWEFELEDGTTVSKKVLLDKR